MNVNTRKTNDPKLAATPDLTDLFVSPDTPPSLISAINQGITVYGFDRRKNLMISISFHHYKTFWKGPDICLFDEALLPYNEFARMTFDFNSTRWSWSLMGDAAQARVVMKSCISHAKTEQFIAALYSSPITVS